MNMNTDLTLQRQLTEKLREASDAYYGPGAEIMSDIEFDRLFDKLKEMEKNSGVIFSGSPTAHVGGVSVDYLEKSTHEQPALSLDKYKYEDREKLLTFLKYMAAFLSWKLDGLTIVLTYDGGRLIKAVTRGRDGIEGDVVTHNAVFFKGVPHEIPFKGHLVIRGEAVMSYREFDRINAEGGSYENPRNLAGATVQMYDGNESRKREICFKAFQLVTPSASEGPLRYMHERMNWLRSLGFDTVDFVYEKDDAFYDPEGSQVDGEDLLAQIEVWKEKVKSYGFPTDGLVITFEDQVYAEEQGSTGTYSKGSMALKWTDKTVATILRGIEWSVGKTGVMTPVGDFDPVRPDDGSTVTRASLHNVSVMENIPEADGDDFGHDAKMEIGVTVYVGLANKIIPQIFSFKRNGKPTIPITIPKTCPVCGAPTELRVNNGVKTLHCTNVSCAARRMGLLMNTFGRDALYAKGLGESQIADLLRAGLVDQTPASFFKMSEKVKKDRDAFAAYEDLMEEDGWGVKKWENIVSALEAARNTTLQKFLYGLNIQLLGNDLSKKLSAYWKGNVENFMKFVDFAAENPVPALEELTALDGVGAGKAMPLIEWAQTVRPGTRERDDLEALIGCLAFDSSMYDEKEDGTASLEGLTFVITGAVHQYKNRDEFRASVEARGGKVAGSVSKNTDYLVNNDVASTSGKNKKAKELGIPVISEDEFIEKFSK